MRGRDCFFVYFLVAVALPLSKVNAAHYFVDSRTGSDDYSGRTKSSAWRTFRQLNTIALQAADTITLMRGSVWHEASLRISGKGEVDSPIVITSSDDTAFAIPSITSKQPGIMIVGGKNVLISKIEVKGGSRACVETSPESEGITFKRMELSDCGIGAKLSGRGIIFQESRLNEMKIIRNTRGKAGTNEANDDYGAIGVVLKNIKNCSINSNVIRNCRAPSFDYKFDGGAVEIWNSAANCEIHSNRTYNTDGFIEVGGGRSDTVRDVSVHHNLSFEVGSYSWLHGKSTRDSFSTTISNVRFYHNTAITRKRAVAYFVGVGGQLLGDSAASVFNNLVISDTLRSAFQNPEEMAHARNLFWTSTSSKEGLGIGGGDLYGKPEFVDSAKGDYRLRSNSIGVNTAVKSRWNTDIQGKPFPEGRLPDVGAFQR